MNALGRSRGGFSTKIHVLTEANGLPLAIHLTLGQTADIAAAPDLLALGEARPRELLADKGCGRRRPARGAISAWRAPDHPVEVEPQSARHARPSPLCKAQLHRAHDGFAEAVSLRRDALRQNRRELPQLRSNRSHPSLDALCPHGLGVRPVLFVSAQCSGARLEPQKGLPDHLRAGIEPAPSRDIAAQCPAGQRTAPGSSSLAMAPSRGLQANHCRAFPRQRCAASCV